MPVIVSQVYNYRYEHWECFILIGFQNVKEVVILKEAHSSISNLQMNSSNTSDNSLKEFWDQMFNFIDFTNFKDFL